ncbi:uncharacterized protein LOC62_01G001051 [Vanrija pseudolonga]|uniref:Uncharacterized protein n=1 Tax=Vanrija pseudolonga TaxID=143232 RepID=A0AAF1BFH1_9TREE|nr:hypothetical protein LOC62_01G001051 [Vanrija pseudolonga]
MLLDHLFLRMETAGRFRTDDMTLQTCASLLIASLEHRWRLDLNSFRIQGCLHLLFGLISTKLFRVERRSTTRVAVCNGLAYGALAVFFSDKYASKVWKNSRWELAVETTGNLARAAAGASTVPGVSSTVTGVVALGSTAVSKRFRQKEDKLLKVVYSVARKFELQVLREAEEGRLRGQHDWFSKDENGLGFTTEALDDFILTASLVFNIIVSETKVPLTIAVAEKSRKANVSNQNQGQSVQDLLKLLLRHSSPPSNDPSTSPEVDASSSPEANASASPDAGPTA